MISRYTKTQQICQRMRLKYRDFSENLGIILFSGKKGPFRFEIFEDLSHTMLKIQPQLTEAVKFNQFRSDG